MTLIELRKTDRIAHDTFILYMELSRFGKEEIILSQMQVCSLLGVSRQQLRGSLQRLQDYGFAPDVSRNSITTQLQDYMVFDDFADFPTNIKPSKPTPKRASKPKVVYEWKRLENPEGRMEKWYNYFIDQVINNPDVPKINEDIQPLDYENFVKLVNRLGRGEDPERDGIQRLKEYYLQFANNTEYQKNKKSLYLTFVNWDNRDKSRK